MRIPEKAAPRARSRWLVASGRLGRVRAAAPWPTNHATAQGSVRNRSLVTGNESRSRHRPPRHGDDEEQVEHGSHLGDVGPRGGSGYRARRRARPIHPARTRGNHRVPAAAGCAVAPGPGVVPRNEANHQLFVTARAIEAKDRRGRAGSRDVSAELWAGLVPLPRTGRCGKEGELSSGARRGFTLAVGG
jgi:hypothetical protein